MKVWNRVRIVARADIVKKWKAICFHPRLESDHDAELSASIKSSFLLIPHDRI